MPRSLSLVLLALGAALAGCTPKIGDECASSIDCSQQGERLCDTMQKDGYCTIFNCEPDTCPEDEAVCVAFDSKLDPACGGSNDTDWARFGRTFCMAVCDDDGDCRDGYECANPSDMLIIDSNPAADKYCIQKAPAPAAPAAPAPPICSPDAGEVDLDAFLPDVGTGGSGGTGGTGGTAGGGGTGGSAGSGGQGGAGGAGGVSGGGGTGG